MKEAFHFDLPAIFRLETRTASTMPFVPLGLDLEGDFNFGLGALAVSSLLTISSFSDQNHKY
jgi:hypothetical protein